MNTLHELAHLLNELIAQRDDTARLLLERAAHLPVANVRALKAKHAQLSRRVARLQKKIQ